MEYVNVTEQEVVLKNVRCAELIVVVPAESVEYVSQV